MAGSEMSDFVMSSVIYNEVFQCKVYKKGVSLFCFFFLPLDLVTMMYGQYYFPPQT